MSSADISRNTRRAAQMFDLWERGGSDDIASLVAEADEAGEDLMNVVCSLLHVGSNLVKAAAHGERDEYLEQLLGAALVAEALDGEPDAWK
ncbi:MAG: hypothetical protein ABR585_07510 [Gemmatimonadaceae bacterium]